MNNIATAQNSSDRTYSLVIFSYNSMKPHKDFLDQSRINQLLFSNGNIVIVACQGHSERMIQQRSCWERAEREFGDLAGQH